MSILISGSVAFDTIIQTVGSFRTQDMQGDDLHLSLFSPVIRKEYGGTAANIAYSLSQLGKPSTVIAAIGEDGQEYILRMKEMGINTELVNIVPGSYCPQAYIMRDEGNGQINTFHPGAMSTSGELTHGTIPFRFAIVSPDAKEGMIRRVEECKKAGIFTIFDPGQAMGIFSPNELRSLTMKADITIMNEPEQVQFRGIAGEDFTQICKVYGHIAIVTLSEKGSIIQSTTDEMLIAPMYVENIVDATGCGDAFRAGLLYGLSEGWNLEKSCKLGSILGGIKIQFMGGQNHTLEKDHINRIGAAEFSEKFFD